MEQNNRDEYFNVLDLDEIKRRYFHYEEPLSSTFHLAGCFWLYNDGTEAYIDDEDIPTWLSVLHKLKDVDGIGVEKDNLREITIGVDTPPIYEDSNKVYIQYKNDVSLVALIRTAIRMAPDRLIIKDLEKYPDILSGYAFAQKLLSDGILDNGYFEFYFGNEIDYKKELPIYNSCFIRPAPAPNPKGDYAIYERLGNNRAQVIFEGSKEHCDEIIKKIEAMKILYDNHKYNLKKTFAPEKFGESYFGDDRSIFIENAKKVRSLEEEIRNKFKSYVKDEHSVTSIRSDRSSVELCNWLNEQMIVLNDREYNAFRMACKYFDARQGIALSDDVSADELLKWIKSDPDLSVKYDEYCNGQKQSQEMLNTRLQKMVMNAVKGICNEDGLIEAYWDYNDKIDGDVIFDAIKIYTGDDINVLKKDLQSGMSFRNVLEDYVYYNYSEMRVYYEDKLIDEVTDIIEKQGDEELKELWSSFDYDEQLEFLERSGYNGIDYNLDDLLRNSRLQVNVLFATANELNLDNGSIIESFGNGWKDPTCVEYHDDKACEDALDNSLTYLIHQQGYLVEDFYDVLYKEKSSDSKFLNSLKCEIENNTADYQSQLTCLIELSGKQIIDFFEDAIKGENCIQFDKHTEIGLFTETVGGGSVLEIELEKPFVVPSDMIHHIQIEGTKQELSPSFGVHDIHGYTVNDTYGLVGSVWRDTFSNRDDFSKTIPSPIKEWYIQFKEDLVSANKNIKEYIESKLEGKEREHSDQNR